MSYHTDSSERKLYECLSKRSRTNLNKGNNCKSWSYVAET